MFTTLLLGALFLAEVKDTTGVPSWYSRGLETPSDDQKKNVVEDQKKCLKPAIFTDMMLCPYLAFLFQLLSSCHAAKDVEAKRRAGFYVKQGPFPAFMPFMLRWL